MMMMMIDDSTPLMVMVIDDGDNDDDEVGDEYMVNPRLRCYVYHMVNACLCSIRN